MSLPLTLSYSSKVWSASTDVDIERESGTEQPVAYADYDNQSSFVGASAPGLDASDRNVHVGEIS